MTLKSPNIPEKPIVTQIISSASQSGDSGINYRGFYSVPITTSMLLIALSTKHCKGTVRTLKVEGSEIFVINIRRCHCIAGIYERRPGVLHQSLELDH